ncbi:heavy metal translocating P-type ATPase (plasmid) [Meiothermus taiwanensis WR-220]|uniref:HMA domain-containing protein n=4 Tax=Thermaceae TaxID=188786 RepID=A0A511R5M2_9DEIN|nr:heavy metal translocating P-type ATPase [Calidithermus chliarophilus]AWR88173.1 heavy metal translocating P-type ATPase [Meiothermus taiwanensis WR-220]KZK17104.1 hypothetical protein A3962_13245 [Meiothermus taiwanensis]RIH74800.1 hypothetical protein Mhypo_03183 [Meiothermus hypogaeus]GEM84875.1 hypothetical protein MHY01S_30410 [Meiothermus hypogaeus NBRC 106114]GIW29779.1 MAG: hypothetical protein KatS3mg070_3142 [Meiothermus sp.]
METHAAHSSPRWPVLEVSFKNCYDASELADVEAFLAQFPGVQQVHLDRTTAVAHLSYDPARTDEAAIRKRLKQAGYDCDCRDCVPSTAQPGHPSLGHEGHGHDPASTGHHALAQHSAPVHDHAAMGHTAPEIRPDHAGVGHTAHDEHAGHSSPDDMLRRFLISLALTIPVVIFSPIGGALGFPDMPPFGLSVGLWGFLLATPVV